MLTFQSRRAEHRPWWRVLLLVAALGVVFGCSNNDDDSPPGSGTPVSSFLGVMINGSENGKLVVSVSSGSLAPAPGALSAHATQVLAGATFYPIGSAPVALAGTYDVDTDSLSLSGGGYAFTTMVEVDTAGPASFIAEYTGPNGPGFAGAVQNSGLSQTVFCGSFSSDSMALTGNLGLLIEGTDVGGIGVPNGLMNPEPFSFEGTVSGTGTMRTITAMGGETGVLEVTMNGTWNTVTGVISGTYFANDIMGGQDDGGTWTVSPCP